MNINDKIFEFINSKDIAEYLKSLDYTFTLPEAAFLVYQSNKHTLKEKFAAWEQIIKKMPDCTMDERLNMVAIPSFHAFLRSYMDLQQKKLKGFYDNKNAVYYYRLWDENGRINNSQPFSSADICFAALKKEAEESTLHNIAFNGGEIWRYFLDKENDYSDTMSIVYTGKFAIQKINVNGLTNEDFDIDLAFDGMWFSLPTPFKKGDLVVERSRSAYRGTPRVLIDICTEFDNAERLKTTADISDMIHYGYYIEEGELFYECGHEYLSLEYYREPLKGKERLLEIVQLLIKDKCNLGDFCLIKEALWAVEETEFVKHGLELLDYWKAAK